MPRLGLRSLLARTGRAATGAVRAAPSTALRLLKQQIITSIVFSVGVAVGEAVMRFLHHHRRAAAQKHTQRGASSLQDEGRCFAVVTTAAMPWRTGTSMNPMLRAAHLAHDGPAAASRRVLLVVPWVDPEQQPLIYPPGVTFATKEEQAAYILEDARKRTGLPCNFSVLFYAGRYFSSFGSIFPVEDVVGAVPAELRDVAILEEPEHLNWFNHGRRWSDAFSHVVGIMHTNYLAYVREGQATGFLNAAAVYRVNRWVCRIHCDKIVKLSDAVQKLPHQVTCNVHGVASVFLDVGRAKAAQAAALLEATRSSGGGAPAPAPAAPAPAASGGNAAGADATHQQQQQQAQHQAPQQRFTRGAYFIGKAVWGKGYRELIALGAEYDKAKPDPLVLDVVGAGEDLAAIQAAAASKGLSWAFLGARDHADASMQEYQVFINPSTSDVVATTTAEALAMGKWAVVPDIACNAFFKQFRNCLAYGDAAGFVAAVDRALTREPAPLSETELRKLSWEAATERLLDVGSIGSHEWPSASEQRYTAALWRMWRSIVGFTALREALGMTSATGLEEPEISESESEEDDAAEVEAHAQRPQPPAAAAAAAGGGGQASPARAGPALPPRRGEQAAAAAPDEGASAAAAAAAAQQRRSFEAKAARAAQAQAALVQARSMAAGDAADWDLDFAGAELLQFN